ncbi:MAG TPA: cation diffusion facilitator family transporter [Gemmatimonadaceae bacterium]
MTTERKTVVYAEIAANVAVMAAKFLAAALSGSSAMLAEGFHSLADTGDGLLLLVGQHLSQRPPDPEHPFGHGLELYFWTFIIALLIFAIGGGLSIYDGVHSILNPEPLENALWSYVVLGIALVFDGGSFLVAWRKFRHDAGKQGLWQALTTTRDLTVATVLLENSSDLVGILLAFLGVLLAHVLQQPVLDGIASVLIGFVLVAVASFLGYQSRSLLTGERADPRMIAGIRSLVESNPMVVSSGRPMTLQLGPDTVLLALELQFRPMLSAGEAADVIDALERTIRDRYPIVKKMFIEAEALSESRGEKRKAESR